MRRTILSHLAAGIVLAAIVGFALTSMFGNERAYLKGTNAAIASAAAQESKVLKAGYERALDKFKKDTVILTRWIKTYDAERDPLVARMLPLPVVEGDSTITPRPDTLAIKRFVYLADSVKASCSLVKRDCAALADSATRLHTSDSTRIVHLEAQIPSRLDGIVTATKWGSFGAGIGVVLCVLFCK